VTSLFGARLPAAKVKTAVQHADITTICRHVTLEQDLEIQRAKQISNIKQTVDNGDPYLNELSRQAFYNKHPYSVSVNGTIETVSSFTRNQLISYLKSRLNTSSMLLVVVGNTTRPEVEKMVKENGPYMANRNLALIKGMFTYAVRVGVLEHSPAAGISPPGKEAAKDRVLSLDEIIKLVTVLENAPRDARDIFLLILLTGQRPGEVSAMRLHQVKGDWWELSGKENKSGRPHRVYLASWARQIIRERINDLNPTDYLFPTNGDKREHVQADNLKTWLHRRLGQEIKKVGIDYFTAHDLRRSAATGMAILGHAAVIGDILNHAPQGVTRRIYDKYDREPEIKRALISWETAIKEALAGGGRKVVEVDFK